MKNYWLMKSEADCYSIDDFKRDKKASWSGVRNYQARNFMRSMTVGDEVIFYHSSSDPTAAVGTAKVVKAAHPDITALDPKDDHYDPKATKTAPIWDMVDIAFTSKFTSPISLQEIKRNPALKGISVAARGNRLSVMPISEAHFKVITKMGEQPLEK
jgi:predicted RNA-binding protein with PUA-like domain